jgi:hypothetical protein
MNSVFASAREFDHQQDIRDIRGCLHFHRAACYPSLARFAQVRRVRHVTQGILRSPNGLSPPRDGGSKNSLQICPAIWMARKIKSSEIQCRQVVSVLLRTGRGTYDDCGNFNRLALQMANDVSVGAVNQPETAKTGSHSFLGEYGSYFIHAPYPDRLQRVHLEQLTHAGADRSLSGRYEYRWLGKSGLCGFSRFAP